MRVAIACAALFAVAARSGCGDAGAAPYDPCAGKACGEPCRACAPDDRDCYETAVVKACDPAGRCVADAPGLCGDGGAAPCAGKSCGAACTVDPPCRAATPPCAMPSVAGTCSADGTCLPPGLPVPACPPSRGCEGKACGDPCGYCPPDADPARCPVPTFAPTACDAALQCVTQGTFTCP